MGETIDEAIRMIHEAIELHLEDLIANGEPVPAEDSENLPETQTLVIDV